MLYGIITAHESCFMIGCVLALKEMSGKEYVVLEGHCDFIRKDAVKLISKREYTFIRSVQDEVLAKASIFSGDAREFIGSRFEKRNVLD